MGIATIDFQFLFHLTPTPLMVLDTDMRFVEVNECYLGVTGRSRGELIGNYLFDCFPETGERLENVRNAFVRALAGEANTLERIPYTIDRPDGVAEDRWWTAEHLPLRDENGTIVGLLQNTRDVTEEVVATRMRDVISEEYDHRVRNMLAKVSAVARRTAHGASSLKQFITDFDPRIAAMARAHDLLVHGGWEELSLAELMTSELQPYVGRADSQVRINGPVVALSSHVAQALGMALHELATNAAKYGALSRAGGHLDIHWSLGAKDGALRLLWSETGVPIGDLPARAGFGSTIIDRVLPAETGGEVDRRFTADGLVCTIDIPSPRKT